MGYLCLIITLIIIIIILVYLQREYGDVVYCISDIDGQSYLVRERPDKQQACNMLATIKKNMFILSKYLEENIKEFEEYRPYIIQLNEKIYDSTIMESGENNVYTSYSVNKGEQIIFCLRSRAQQTHQLHDINMVMYVVLHEMSHVACPEYGHTQLFKKIFGFLAKQAIEIGLYTKINFEKFPAEYCGLMITDSII